MTKLSDDSCRHINLPPSEERNFMREKRVDRTATKQIDFSWPDINGRPEGPRGCPRLIQVFRKRNSRTDISISAWDACVRIKLENTRVHTPSRTSSATTSTRNFISPILDGRCNGQMRI